MTALFCNPDAKSSNCAYNTIFTAFLPTALVALYLIALVLPHSLRRRLRASPLASAFQPFVTPEQAAEIAQRERQKSNAAFAYDVGHTSVKDDQAEDEARPDAHAASVSKGKRRAVENGGQTGLSLSNGSSSRSSPTTTESTPLLNKHASKSKTARRVRHSGSSLALLVLSALQVGAWCTLFAYQVAKGPSRDASGKDATVLTSALVLVTWTYSFLRIALKPQRKPPYDLFVLYWFHIVGAFATLFHLGSDIASGRSSARALRTPLILESANTVVTALAQVIVFSMPIAEGEEAHSDSFELACSLWSWTTFNWMNPLIKTALGGAIEKRDLWIMPMTSRAAVLYGRFQELRQSTLLRRLYTANATDFWTDAVLTVVSAVLSYGRPYCVQQILRTIQATASGSPDANLQTAYLYAFLVLLLSIIVSESDLNHLYVGRRMSVRVKAELIAAVYAKALRRKDSSGLVQSVKAAGVGPSPTADTADKKDKKSDEKPKEDGAADVGKIVSIMAVDAVRVGDACQGFYQIWSAPIQLLVALVFLYKLLGLSAFAGCISFVFFSPVQGALMKRYWKNVKKVNSARDKRMTSLTEIIGNLKIIRLCGWVPRWTARVLEQRKQEIAIIRVGKFQGAIIGATFELVPVFVSILSFASFVLIEKKTLDTATAFTALALFNVLGGPMSFLPMIVTSLAETYLSLQRVEAFLEEEDVPERVQSALIRPDAPFDDALGCENASFRWRLKAKKKDANASGSQEPKPRSMISRLTRPFKRRQAPEAAPSSAANAQGDDDEDEQKPFELIDISLSCPVGKLTLVCGSTGSGKSSLLAALLGEMDLVEGKVFLPKQPHYVDPVTGLNGRVAYCSQTPWLCSQSIKENILFGTSLDQERYEQVIEACALKPDLMVLVDGDATQIGEKGTTLSGGQKARVALARALYSRAKTVVLDDVLAAVDSHTASHLVEKVLQGPLLRDRTVILVSHHVTLVMPAAAWVVRIANGRVAVQGTPAEVRASGELGDLLQEAEKEEEVAAEIAAAEAPPPSGVEKVDDGPAGAPAPALPGKPKQLITEEARARGAVKLTVYHTFIRAFGYLLTLTVLLLGVGVKVLDTGSSIWLARWTSSYEQPVRTLLGLSTLRHLPPSVDTGMHQHHLTVGLARVDAIRNGTAEMHVEQLPPPNENVLPWIGIYAAILLGTVAVKITIYFLNFVGQLRASRSLFDQMLWSVVRANARWIDTTPLGRILNRFSKDIEVLDGSLASNLRAFMMTAFDIAGAIFIITFTVPPFLFPAVVILLTYYWIGRGYMAAGRDLRRHESLLRSPIFSAFGELLQGIAVVRAMGAEDRYMATLCCRVDEYLSAHFYQWMGNRWLLLRFEILGGTTIFCTSVLCLSGGIPAGWSGVAMAQALNLTQYVYWMCRFATSTEQDLSSVERVSEYLPPGIPAEKAKSAETKPAPAYWPSNTQGISVEGLEFKYAPELEPVLHRISFDVKPGERIAVVGRTGSGKSTLALALLRFNEFSAGSIHIDGVDISTIDLDDLRSRITLIPQDPVMFKGTVRENLDPFGEHHDATLIQTLQRCQLRVHEGSTTPAARDGAASKAASASASRAASVSAGSSDEATLSPESARLTLDSGATLSQGQRQLLAMARSILRGSRVCIMDEASASLDFETDRLIQTMIRQEFDGSILITIAHRLSTVIDYDRVLVMEHGHIREYDTPHALLQNRDGIFFQMVQKSGEGDKLHAAAAEAAARAQARRG